MSAADIIVLHNATACNINFINFDNPPPSKWSKQRAQYLHNLISKGDDNNLRSEIKFIYPGDDESPLLSIKNNRTVLQNACTYHDKVVALKMASVILETEYNWKKFNKEKFKALLLNYQTESDGYTALHLAAFYCHRDVVLLLIKAGADITLRCKRGKSAIQLIFDLIPDIITKIFKLGLKKEDPTEDVFSESSVVKVDFRLLSGQSGATAEQPLYSETLFLFGNLWKSSKPIHQQIVGHPLVKLFILAKWKRMGHLINFFAMIKILWCCLYMSFTFDLYWLKCPNIEESCSSSITRSLSLTGMGWTMLCFWTVCGVISILKLLLLPKEFKFYFQHFWDRPENLFVLVLLSLSWYVVRRVVILRDFPPGEDDVIEYNSAASGIIISSFIIMWQIKKIPLPHLRVLVDLFMKVIKRILMFIFAHAVLLIAFSLAFPVLMPKRPEFNFAHGGVFKVIIMMTTGELNYDSLFHSQDAESTVPAPLFTKAFLVIYALTMNAAFYSVMIGFAISDCQQLLDKSEVRSLECKLEEIHILEQLLLSRPIQTRWRKAIEKFMVSNEEGFSRILFREIPEDLQYPIVTILND